LPPKSLGPKNFSGDELNINQHNVLEMRFKIDIRINTTSGDVGTYSPGTKLKAAIVSMADPPEDCYL
jgi:hypothetical protein